MTDFARVAEIPKPTNEDEARSKRFGSVISDFALGNVIYPLADGRLTVAAVEKLTDTAKEAVADETSRNVLGGLALVAAVSTATQVEHWLDHSGMAGEFFAGSGRHFAPGYAGFLVAMAASKAETVKGKIAAGLFGGALGDLAAELIQSLAVTGALHHGSLKDILSFLSKKEVFWGNAKDALAAEMAAVGGIVQVLLRRQAEQAEVPLPANESL